MSEHGAIVSSSAFGKVTGKLCRRIRFAEEGCRECVACVGAGKEHVQGCGGVVYPWQHNLTRRHRQRHKRLVEAELREGREEPVVVYKEILPVQASGGAGTTTHDFNRGPMEVDKCFSFVHIGVVVVSDRSTRRRLRAHRHDPGQHGGHIRGDDATGPTDVVVG